MLDAVIQPVERVIEGQCRIAAKAEYMAHAMQLEHPHHRFGAGHHIAAGIILHVASFLLPGPITQR